MWKNADKKKMWKNGLHQHRSKQHLQRESIALENENVLQQCGSYAIMMHPTIKESTIQVWVWSFVIVMVRSWSVEWENFREEKLQHKQNWQLLYGLCKHVRHKDILMWYLKWTMKQSTTSSVLHIVSSIITYSFVRGTGK